MNVILDQIKKLTSDQKDELLTFILETVIRADANSIALLQVLKENDENIYDKAKEYSSKNVDEEFKKMKNQYPSLSSFIDDKTIEESKKKKS